MIKLGYCKHCSGTLAVKSGLLRDGPLTEERDADGNRLRAIHRDETGQPIQNLQVFCLKCGAEAPEHPHKQQLDEAQKKAQQARAATAAVRAAAPTVYSQASQSEMVADALARLTAAVESLTDRVAALEADQAARKGRQHASK